MTVYYPISSAPLQYNLATGLPASGYVLKAYSAGTSTPLALAIDNAGSTTVADVTLNSSGYPVVSGNIVVLYASESYKLALYATQAAADANSGAIWNPDNIPLSQTSTLDAITDVLYDTSVDNNMIIGRNTPLASGAKFNVFVGEGAGSTASTSATDNNTCVGYHAGTAITSGSTNTMVGSTSGDAITTGTSNTTVGYGAGGAINTGASNTAVGASALAAISSSGSCTAIGNQALFSTTGASNVGVGLNAGQAGTPNTTGTSNTFIGTSSQANGAAYTNGTALGANAILTASNTMQLGDSGVTQVICGTSNTASIRALNTAKAFGCVAVSAATPTLEESFNITSITDTSTGQLTVTIATDMANATYTVVTGAELTATTYAVANDRKVYVRFGTQAVGAFDLDCIDSTAVTNVVKDPETWYFAVLGKH